MKRVILGDEYILATTVTEDSVIFKFASIWVIQNYTTCLQIHDAIYILDDEYILAATVTVDSVIFKFECSWVIQNDTTFPPNS